MGKLLSVAWVLVAVACCGQAPVAKVAEAGSVVAANGVVFEAATVKRNRSASSSSHSSYSDGRFTASNVSLKNLIQYSAYGVPGSRIVGGPKWLDSERFDIEAKLDGPSTEKLRALSRRENHLQTQAMFQQLLADRFKLTTHWETREMPVYDLVVAKSGAKLQPMKDAKASSGTDTEHGHLTANGITPAELARALTQEVSGELGRVIVDKTGLTGRYDMELKWTPDSDSAPEDAGPSIFTAAQEQLGLKLEPSKGPVEVLVIDRAEMPTEN